MVVEEKEFISIEVINDQLDQNDPDNDYYQFIDINEQTLDLCWGIKALEICIVKANDKEVVLFVKLAGIRLAKITLTKAKACAKLKKSINGDTASVKLKICADFDKKILKVKGKVCAIYTCTKFNQRILKW